MSSEKLRKYFKEYYKKHSYKIKKRSRAWTRANTLRASIRKAAYYKTNRKEILQGMQIYNSTPARKKRHQEIARKSHLKITFKMSLEDFKKLFNKQGKKCAGCGSKVPQGRNWSVDHNHTCCAGKKSCGKCIRGILCAPCNQALGMTKDCVKTLLRLVRYLQNDIPRLSQSVSTS